MREPKEEDKNTRIFIKIPKTMTEKEVEEKFKVSEVVWKTGGRREIKLSIWFVIK